MTDPFHDEPRYLTELPDDLREKRAAARRRRQWRRRLAVGALVAVAGAVVALAISGLGGGGDSGEAGSQARQTAAQGPSRPQHTGPTFPAGWKPHQGPVPILEYHGVEPPPTGAPFPELFVEPQDFEGQMGWLDDQGYEAVTLDQVEDAWYEDGRLPPKPIVVSFDDGYLSQYDNAFPVLRKLDWPGLLNLKTDDSDLPDADVQKLLDAGWELGSHTISHVDLTLVDSTQLQREVAGSRRILQRRFDVPVDNFCYPLGRYDTTVIAAVHKAGYRGATTEIPRLGEASHPYILGRLEIELSDGLTGFISKLTAAEGTAAAGATTTTYPTTTAYPTTTTTSTTSTTTTTPSTTTTTRRTTTNTRGD